MVTNIKLLDKLKETDGIEKLNENNFKNIVNEIKEKKRKTQV